MNKTVHNANSFNVFLTNSATLTQSKLQELKLRIDESTPSVIPISEVKPKHFKREIQLSEYNFDVYELMSRESPARGMIMYIKDSLKYSPVVFDNIEYEENMLCEIEVEGKKTVLIGSLCRSPTSSDNQESVKKHYYEVILFGDINLPNISWIDNSTNCNEDSMEFKFIESICDCFLYQHGISPTRGRGSDNPSVIDLVLTSEEEIISELNITHR